MDKNLLKEFMTQVSYFARSLDRMQLIPHINRVLHLPPDEMMDYLKKNKAARDELKSAAKAIQIMKKDKEDDKERVNPEESLTESPDGFEYQGKKYNYRSDGIPFMMKSDTGQMFVGDSGDMHVDMYDYTDIDSFTHTDYDGRLFPKPKIITFWKYPKSKKELLDVIHKLNKKGQKIDKNWKIEVLLTGERKTCKICSGSKGKIFI